MRFVYLADGSSVDVGAVIASLGLPQSGPYPDLPPVSQSLNCLPPAAETMTNAISHLGGFADVTNTGAPTEVGLPRIPEDVTSGTGWVWDPRGWVQVASDDAVLDGFYISANVNVQDARDVLVQNCVIELGGDTWGISLVRASGVRILNNTIRGMEQLGPLRLDNGIRDIFGGPQASDPITVMGNNIYWCSSGLNHITGGGLIQGNYIHDMGFNDVTELDHTNGLQSEGSNGSLLAIRGNTILVDRGQTDALMISGYEGLQENRLVEHNLFAGGGFTLYGRGASSETARRIIVRGNHFGRIFFENSGFFGPVAYWDLHPSNQWVDNVWDDTGLPVGF